MRVIAVLLSATLVLPVHAQGVLTSLREYSGAHPDDPQGWIALGRALITNPASSNDPRVQAILAFRRAIALAPNSKPAWDGLADAGMQLGGADGEADASEALQRLLSLDPQYPNAWERWLVLYRNRGERQRMIRILMPNAERPAVAGHVAQLDMEDERFDAADSILDGTLQFDSSNTCWLALRAQSAFERGDQDGGARFYGRALAHADHDAACLWNQIIGIATPEEIRAWPSVPDSARRLFLAQFWQRRDPDLFRSTNARIAEHFARLRIARKRFALHHPLASYQREREGRALESAPSIAEQMFYQRCEATVNAGGATRAYDRARRVDDDGFGDMRWNPLSASLDRLHDLGSIQPPGTLYLDPSVVRLISIPHSRDIRDVDTTAARIGYNIATGLDDRGIAYLRFGEPKRRVIGSDNTDDAFCRVPDLERWEYDDIGTVRFFRPNAVFVGLQGGVRQTGDMLFRPMGPGQFEATSAAMSRDASSVPAELQFGFWTVEFKGSEGRTDVIVVTTRGEVAARLVGGDGHTDSASALDSSGIVMLSHERGLYTLEVHARFADSLGRQTAAVRIRNFAATAVSDVLLAPAWDTVTATRSGMIQHLARGLTFDEGTTLRSYLELYEARANEGHVQYRAIYQLARTTNAGRDVQRDSLPGALTLAFDRDRRPEPIVVEQLDIEPERLPSGRYLLRIDLRDSEGRRLGRAQITFSVRPR